MSSIYIQIASYRDPDLWNTIKNAIESSSKKRSLHISVVDQYSDEDKFEDIRKNFKNLKASEFCKLSYKKVHYTKTKGVCWVRHLLNKKYQGENYTLQLDSHHRFVKDWDSAFVKMYRDLKKEGYKKPLLTTYCPAYIQQTEERFEFATQMDFDRFTPEGAVFFSSGVIPDWENRELPVPSKFISGHMIFTDGKFCQQVPYDPHYLFHGEEINLTVRAYTHG